MKELFKLITFGDTLATRKKGLDIRLQLEMKLQDRNLEHLTLDFEGIELVTHGFIDELLGKLIDDFDSSTLNNKLQFKSAEKQLRVINYVIEDRWKNID